MYSIYWVKVVNAINMLSVMSQIPCQQIFYILFHELFPLFLAFMAMLMVYSTVPSITGVRSRCCWYYRCFQHSHCSMFQVFPLFPVSQYMCLVYSSSYPAHAQGCKVIGCTCGVVVVQKIATSRVLGVWATRNWIRRKLTSVCFKLRDMLHKRDK
jgi:hypothetical protein